MYSKLKLLVGLSVVFTLGCGLKVNEAKNDEEPVEFSVGQYSCMNQIPESFQRYTSDQMDETEISTFMNCMKQSFISFSRLTRGRDEKTYSGDELRNFLQTYFIKNQKISDELLHQFMVLKQVLLGGEVNRISRDELQTLVSLLEEIRLEALKLKPHIQFLNPSLLARQNPENLGEKLNAARLALHNSISVISKRVLQHNLNYSFSDLQKLMVEFRAFVSWESHFAESHSSEAWVKFFTAYKIAFVSPENPGVMRPQDWDSFLDSLARWYISHLQYDVGVKGQDFTQGVGLRNAIYLAQEVMDQLEETVRRQNNFNLPFSSIENVLISMVDLGWLGHIRPQSITQSVEAIVTRVLGDVHTPPNQRMSTGLNLEELAVLKSEFYRWMYAQLQIESTHGDHQGRFTSERLAPPPLTSDSGLTDQAAKVIKSSLQVQSDEFFQIQTLMNPLFNGGSGRVLLMTSGDLQQVGTTWDFYNLSRMNWMRMLVELMFRGYASNLNEQSMWTTNLLSSEVQQFYLDIRDLAIDLGYADPRTFNTGYRSFIEGNLFTYASDGESVGVQQICHRAKMIKRCQKAPPRPSGLSYAETIQLMSFLLSGSNIENSIYQKLIDRKCTQGRPDYFGRASLDRACVQKEIGPILMGEMYNAPRWVMYLEEQKPEQLSLYFSELMQTGYSPTLSDPNWIEPGELATISVIAQYSEALMTRFDKNSDGLLDNNELEAAIPVFMGLIQRMAGEKMGLKDLSEKQARAIFLFILANKRIPEPGFIWGDSMSVGFDAYVFDPYIRLDRFQLMQAFHAIVSKIVGAPASN